MTAKWRRLVAECGVNSIRTRAEARLKALYHIKDRRAFVDLPTSVNSMGFRSTISLRSARLGR